MTSTNICSDAYELDWFEYIFQKTNFPAAFSFTGDGPTVGKLCLFKSDPRSLTTNMPVIGAGGSLEPTTSEYLNYARLSVTRNGTEWTTATSTGTTTVTKATNDAVFATAGAASSVVITWAGFAIETSSGLGIHYLLYAWELVNPLTVTSGIAPRINVGDLTCGHQ